MRVGGSGLAENVGVVADEDSDVVLRAWLVPRLSNSNCLSSVFCEPRADPLRLLAREDVDGSGTVFR